MIVDISVEMLKEDTAFQFALQACIILLKTKKW